MEILIKNCNLISVSDKREKFEKNMDILISNGVIKKIGKKLEESADKIIDATNKIVMPGLINTHTHISMSIFRDTLDGYGLQDWLNQKIWPMEDKLTYDDVYYASYLSCLEMIKTGTTTFNDQYFITEATIKAVQETGLNAHLGRSIMDIMGNGKERLEEFEDLAIKYNNSENITINSGIHSLYTCSEEIVKKAIEITKKYNLYIHMHFAENAKEMEDIKALHNTEKPIDLIEKYFNNMDMILAHGVKVSKEDMKKLANGHISIAHCPISNLRLGCGIAKIQDYLDSNINVSLGTDGQGSGSNLDMFETMKFTALLQKGMKENAKILPSYEVIKMATINGAKALKIEDKTGSIEEGKKADLIILDLEEVITQPINDIFSNIVYNAKGSNVNTTIVNGKILMDNRNLNFEVNNNIFMECKNIIKRIS